MKKLFKVTLIVVSAFFLVISAQAQDTVSDINTNDGEVLQDGLGHGKWPHKTSKSLCKVEVVTVKGKKGVVIKMSALDKSFIGKQKFFAAPDQQDTMLQMALFAFTHHHEVIVKFDTSIGGNILKMMRVK